MIGEILFLILGLALILGGANILTDGASAIAKRWGVSDLVVGLTIVAFGTSAPELVISVISALDGKSGIALGNVVGSNIFNVLMIVGCTALIVPVGVGKGTISKEIPLVVISSVVLWLLSQDLLFDGTSQSNFISRADGLVLLCFFLIFMRYTFSIARQGVAEETQNAWKPAMPVLKAIIYVVGGLAALIFGGDWFVDGASGLARRLGVGENVIGLTLVAMGTSLPELATSIVAAVKKQPGIAVGNVVGSSLFNVFFIIGVSATVHPIAADSLSTVDYSALIGSSLLFLLFAGFFGRRTITRVEGGVMVACYITYTVYLLL